MLKRVVAYILIATGLLLLVATGGYYAYGVIATARLDELAFEAERPSVGATVIAPTAERAPDVLPGGTAGPQPLSSSVAPVTAVSTEPAREPDAPVQAGESNFDGYPGVSDEAARPDVAHAKTEMLPAPAPDQPAASTAGVTESAPPTSDGPSSAEPRDRQVGVASALDGSRRTGQTETGVSLTRSSQASQGPLSQGGQQATAQPSASGGATLSPPAAADANATPDQTAQTAEVSAAAAVTPLQSLLDELAFVPPSEVFLPGTPVGAARIVIPAIHVDSRVEELQLDFSGPRYAWATPKWVVGHVPTSAQPAADGQGWYFGHLESPIRREGNVFQRLPQIPELLREYFERGGDPVHVLLETPEAKYLYEVYRTEVVHQDDLTVTDSGDRDITLVACVPRLVYDHRLLVTAALVGVSQSG